MKQSFHDALLGLQLTYRLDDIIFDSSEVAVLHATRIHTRDAMRVCVTDDSGVKRSLRVAHNFGRITGDIDYPIGIRFPTVWLTDHLDTTVFAIHLVQDDARLQAADYSSDVIEALCLLLHQFELASANIENIFDIVPLSVCTKERFKALHRRGVSKFHALASISLQGDVEDGYLCHGSFLPRSFSWQDSEILIIGGERTHVGLRHFDAFHFFVRMFLVDQEVAMRFINFYIDIVDALGERSSYNSYKNALAYAILCEFDTNLGPLGATSDVIALIDIWQGDRLI